MIARMLSQTIFRASELLQCENALTVSGQCQDRPLAAGPGKIAVGAVTMSQCHARDD